MSAPSFDFDDFVKDVANTIAAHLPREAHAGSQAESVAPGVPAHAAESFLLDHEKVVWHFPDTASRIIEEPR
ncbi:MAG TPA: hypothetical protein VKH19_05535 [Gemmatimonadaceae bacterium]|nr:hypothetical protein [Gemmatimonadaceae bacterium]